MSSWLFYALSRPSPTTPPDLNSLCITYYSWLEFFTLQSTAIANAFTDANKDWGSGTATCGFPGFMGGCPAQPLIYASAFAQGTFATGTDAAVDATAVSPYKATYPGDYYAYLGQSTVAAERTPFPPWTASGALTSTEGPAGQQNMESFSLHSYGKTGLELLQLGSGTAAAIAAARPAPASWSPAKLGYAVTEHAAHTTVVWDGTASHADMDFEASRLAGQVLNNVISGFEAFIFKFSSAEQSQAITPGCTPYAAANNKTLPYTTCGAQKVRRRPARAAGVAAKPYRVSNPEPWWAGRCAGWLALGRQQQPAVPHHGHHAVGGGGPHDHLRHARRPRG